jgi:hypothetical protein
MFLLLRVKRSLSVVVGVSGARVLNQLVNPPLSLAALRSRGGLLWPGVAQISELAA